MTPSLGKFTFCFLACLSCFQVNALELLDPTRPQNYNALSNGVTKDNVESNIKLSAIFIKSKGKYAVVNGEMVVEGQSWNGYEITRVHANGIILKNQDGEKEVLVNNNSIKKDASNDF